jgi:hypothetical protein
MDDKGQGVLLRLSVPKILATEASSEGVLMRTEASSEGVLMRRIGGKASCGALLRRL